MRKMTVLAILVLAGCVSSPQWQWSKEGATRAQFDTQSAECERRSHKDEYVSRVSQAWDLDNVPRLSARPAMVYDYCMINEYGWRLERSES